MAKEITLRGYAEDGYEAKLKTEVVEDKVKMSIQLAQVLNDYSSIVFSTLVTISEFKEKQEMELRKLLLNAKLFSSCN